MRKIILPILLTVISMCFVACGDNGKNSKNVSYNNQCSSYPGTVTVTNQQQVQQIYYYYASAIVYTSSTYACVNSQVYNQLYGNNGNGNNGGNGASNYCPANAPYLFQNSYTGQYACCETSAGNNCYYL